MSVVSNKLKIYGEQAVLHKIDDKFTRVSEYDTFTEWTLSEILNESNLSELTFVEETENLSDKDKLYMFGSSWIDVVNIESTSAMLTIEFDSSWNPPKALAEGVSKAFDVSVKFEYSDPIKDKASQMHFISGYLESTKNYTYLAYHYEVNGDVECLFDLFPLCNSEKDLKLQLHEADVNLQPEHYEKVFGAFNNLNASVKGNV
jgi:hypothetical protein|tara:strand:+ start:618 stop:1226 length:609 start_codon:yes stop_codon:yes gene_type:complete